MSICLSVSMLLYSQSVGLYLFAALTPSFVRIENISTEAGSEGNFVETRSEIERRLLHATAVLRCVNGLVEPGQKGVTAAPVQSLARNVGLPAWVVDMRHEISHKELPSLSTLRLGSDFLLKYLWGYVHYYPVIFF